MEDKNLSPFLVNNMVAYVLVTQGAKALASIVLISL